MLLVLHGAFARCALLAQPATPSGSAPSPPHTCAGVSCLALPSPPSPFPTSRRLSAHPQCAVSRRRDHCLPRRRPSVSDGQACALQAHAASAPSRVPTMLLPCYFPPTLPLPGTGVMPPGVLRRGLPWRYAPSVPVPRFIIHISWLSSLPSSRGEWATLRVFGEGPKVNLSRRWLPRDATLLLHHLALCNVCLASTRAVFASRRSRRAHDVSRLFPLYAPQRALVASNA